MCGRYVSVQSIKVIERRFNIRVPSNIVLEPSYNISPGKYAPVITDAKPKELQLFQFGLTPFWAKKRMYLFNARAEGDRNKENKEEYSGAKGIITKPSFRKPIRSQRCLVIADAFYEGSMKEKLNKPYLVYLQNKQRPFCFAGIWDTWKDEDAQDHHSFAIITVPANTLLRKIGHERAPVILHSESEHAWLRNELPLSDVTSYLRPYPADLMNAYPVDNQMKNSKVDGRHLVEPIGQRLVKELTYQKKEDWRLEGMGSKRGYLE